MPNKEFSAYGGDKIIDLENENVVDAFSSAVGGGGSAIATYSITGTTVNATYNDIVGNFTNNIMPVVYVTFTEEFGTYTGLVIFTGAANIGGNFIVVGLGGMWTGNVQSMIFAAESATTPLELQTE